MNDGAASISMLAVLVVKCNTGEMTLFQTTGGTVFFVAFIYLWTYICLRLLCNFSIETFPSNISSGTVKTGAFQSSSVAFFEYISCLRFLSTRLGDIVEWWVRDYKYVNGEELARNRISIKISFTDFLEGGDKTL